MHWRTALFVFALATSLCARNKIAHIDFFGYQGIDVDAVRKALPFREGDKVTKDVKEQVQAAVKSVTGREATDVAKVCCTGDSDYAVFIGLPGKSRKVFTFSPAPIGDVTAPPELTTLHREVDQAEEAAVKKGASEEGGEPGYRLLKEPRARAAELALREYALHHEDEIIGVLKSSGKAAQRSVAADALGYGARTPRQMAALVRATRDPDSDVRNDATRALSEILRGDPSVATQVPPDNFIDMIRSGIWTDRNKSSAVLWPLTQSRDPQLLARLKSEAGDALLEMARWRAESWAITARVVLGRIAGIPEERINELAMGPLDAFLSAIGH
jgi:hypothetical protein